MTSNTIFRRLDHPSPKEGFVSKVDTMEMLDHTDSSTEVLSIENEVSQTVQLKAKVEQVLSLVSERSDTEMAREPSSCKQDGRTLPVLVTPESKESDIVFKEQEIEDEKKTCEPYDFKLNTIFDKDHKSQVETPHLRPRRGRIVSLDRGRQDQRGNTSLRENGYRSPDSASPYTDGEVQRRSYSFHDRHSYHGGGRKHQEFDDDESSSDDDSSYFASNLPSPKSGRRKFSISSTASDPARAATYQLEQSESGASLSFSDESDDECDHRSTTNYNHQPFHSAGAPTGVHLSPVMHPNRAVAEMQLYPQRITRVHSVSSLVSSASSENEAGISGGAGLRHSSSVGSLTSSVGTSVSSKPDIAGEITPYFFGNELHGSNGVVGRLQNETVHNVDQLYQPPAVYHGQTYFIQQPSPPVRHQYMSAGEMIANHPIFQPSEFGSAPPSNPSSGSIPLVYSEDDDSGPYVNPSMRTLTNQAAYGGGSAGMPAFGYGRTEQPGNTEGRDLLSPNAGNVQRYEPPPSASTTTNALIESSVAKLSDEEVPGKPSGDSRQVFKVYWQRWIMLMYMSILNLLSDWTCYSVAPISLLTEEAFGNFDPERLVVVFLGANAIATACEPIILARLGLRRTVLFGALLLMVGSIVKSGGLPPIIPANLEKGHAEVSLYMGFFIVGLSQPLYQCTPALLSASWFPEKERTMATGVALNANQLGIGFAFIFGTLLVAKADDIPGYFGLLSQISTVVFLGTLIQFDDAPPTPPSSSARAMRGDLKIPRFSRLRSMVRNVTHNLSGGDSKEEEAKAEPPSPATSLRVDKATEKKRGGPKKSTNRRTISARRRGNAPRSKYTALSESGLVSSSMHYGSTEDALHFYRRMHGEVSELVTSAQPPSPAMAGGLPGNNEEDLGAPNQGQNVPPFLGQVPYGIPTQRMMPPGAYGYAYPSYQFPYGDPRIQLQMQQQAYHQQQFIQQQQAIPIQEHQQHFTEQVPVVPPGQMHYYPPPPMMMPYPIQHFPANLQEFDPYYDPYGMDPYEDGAEPIVTITPHNLDIDIRDDQVIRSLHACMIRPGFSHALAAFTVSGIVINTLSTFMDYLVRLNGAPRAYTGIVGGTFQFMIMISSLIIGKQTDKTRAYYSVTIAMLVLGAFSLAECGVSLDSDRGSDLRLSLIVVAVLVGPLQPVSTELGVEVAYPLSENTVLVIQQLFSNLLSAIFIPFFKSLKDIGSTRFEEGELVERPQYTFSFYLLIVLHTGVTVYFATFNGKYLRYEHEIQKKDAEENEEPNGSTPNASVHPFYAYDMEQAASERQPLVQNSA